MDDEGDVVFADILLDSLEEEAKEYMSENLANNIWKVNRGYKCALCPFRSFRRLPQRRSHVQTYHDRKRQFVCSVTKQMKVVLALHDADCVQRSRGADFLFRSALALQSKVSPPLTGQCNSIDKHIRLAFTGTGPAYVNEDAIGKSMLVRKVLHIYSDKDFAKILYQVGLHHAGAPWLNVSLRLLILVAVCAHAFLHIAR